MICPARSSPGPPRSNESISLRPPNASSTAAYTAMITSDPTPPPGSPRAACTASATSPMTRPSPGVVHRDRCSRPSSRRVESLVVDMEDLLHGQPEEAGDGDSERQRGAVAVGLDGIDRLPRDAQGSAEVTL